MASTWVKAQWSVTGSLLSDGTLLLHESFTFRPDQGQESQGSTTWHDLPGTCDPEELAVITHDGIAAHL